MITAAIVLSSGSVPMPVLNASSGEVLRVLHYASQFAKAGAPVPFGDKLYHQAGYFGNVVYAFDAAAGTQDWVQTAGTGIVQEGESLGVDEQYVYFYSAGSLNILSRADGSISQSIVDPFFSSAGLSYYGSYFGAPILDGKGNIFTFSDNRAPNQPRPLIAFARGQANFLWRTAASYINQPALRATRLYAPRANSTIIDVIDTATGAVVSSIDVASGKPNLTSNVVVTESHLFVASMTETYAIDLTRAGNPVVWTIAQGGDLAISPDNLLLISGSTGLFAYALN
ncbi:Pyrrolo-quinoline quinone [Sphingomonas antarctica]|uniref:outer membrane protein assembly factor BamB family protein n=1 Tax=Sphingomonas antarctica TaxID=2040274 RepID=UPI0039EC656B